MSSKKVVLRIPLGRIKAITSMEVTHQDAWGQVFRDKFYKKKGLGIRSMLLYQDIRKKNSMCII